MRLGQSVQECKKGHTGGTNLFSGAISKDEEHWKQCCQRVLAASQHRDMWDKHSWRSELFAPPTPADPNSPSRWQQGLSGFANPTHWQRHPDCDWRWNCDMVRRWRLCSYTFTIAELGGVRAASAASNAVTGASAAATAVDAYCRWGRWSLRLSSWLAQRWSPLRIFLLVVAKRDQGHD